MIRPEDLGRFNEEELYNLAKEYQIKGRTEMGRDELIYKLSEMMVEKNQTIVQKEVRDLGATVFAGASSKSVGSSFMDIKNEPSFKMEGVKIKSPYFDGDDLPFAYGDNRIVLVPKNPQWAYAYWEVSGEKFEEAKKSSGVTDGKLTLRVYDVTLKEFNGGNANAYFDIELPGGVREWFVGGLNPKANYITDLGLKAGDGRFVTVVRSNAIDTPSNSISDRVDEEWMIIEEYFKKILERSSAGRIVNGQWVGGMGASGAMLGSSEEMIAIMLRRLFIEKGDQREKLLAHLERTLSSLGMSSLGVGSLGVSSLSAGSLSLGKGLLEKTEGKDKNKDFWLTVGTELILYGATEPDANVTVMGKPVKLNPDGTFSMRFALPIGHYELPVVAVNADGDDTRQITPIVDRTEK